MRKDWHTRSLGEVCDLQNGFAFKSKSYIDHSNTLNIRMSNIRPSGSFDPEHNIKFLPDSFAEDYSQFLLSEGDLIIAMTDMAGDPKILGLPTLVGKLNGRKFLLNQRVGRLKDFSEDIYVPYLCYFLSSPEVKEYYKSKGAGGLQINISKKDILTAKIPVPSLEEQKRIVAILDDAFAGIDTAIANTEKNLANARELFETYLNTIFTQRGEGWVETTLGDAFDVRDGTHDSPRYQEKGYPLVTSKNLKREGLNLEKVKYISEEDYKKINERSAVHCGDILFAMIGTIGNPIVVEIAPNFAIKNVALFKVAHEQNSFFLKYYLESGDVKKKMQSEAKGTTQKFVGLGYLRRFPMCLPSLNEQATIVNKLNDLSSEAQKLESLYQQKLTALNELKQSLLQKAFSGQLTAAPQTNDAAVA